MRNALKKISYVLFVVLFAVITNFAQDQTTEQQNQTTDQQNQTTTTDDKKNQQLETSAQQLTDNLGTKISLTDDQKQDIHEAIYDYQASVVGVNEEMKTDETDIKDEDKEATGTEETEKEKDATGKTDEHSPKMSDKGDMDQWLNQQIESILEDNQKAQWEVAKADFWNQLRDKVSSFQQDKNKLY